MAYAYVLHCYCWTVLPDGVIQHNFLQKWCNFACLCAWASEGFYPGWALVDFSKSFSRVAKSGEICFLSPKTKKKSFFAEIFKFLLPPLTHPFRCVRKSSCHSTKNWCNFKYFNSIRNSEILLDLIRNTKCLTDQFQLCFCFCIGNTKQLYLFLHCQHNWRPYTKHASCYICFVLSLHSGI